MSILRVGIVGISYKSTTVTAVADIDKSRADNAAKEFSIAHSLTPDELYEHPEVDLVLNLTIPAAHGPVATQAVLAGKHVYNEKPLAVTLEQARTLDRAAVDKGVRVGCAPDTFLGSGIQTARQALDEGMIGEPVAVQAFMLSSGPESWHPSPEFFFKPGGGPMLDMGPYYLTALVNLLGPIRRTTGVSRASFRTRTVGSGPLKGTQIEVDTPTHIVGGIEFASGALGQITTSFDVHFGHMQPITIFGSEGTMLVPDPNNFSGDVKVRRRDQEEWTVVPPRKNFAENSRGVGVLDIAVALEEGRAHRANGALATHVLEVMLSFAKASEEGRHQTIETQLVRPAALGEDELTTSLA
jgi:predicted dehydrogenase